MTNLKIETAADLIEEIYQISSNNNHISLDTLIDFINSEACTKKIINCRTFNGNTPLFMAASLNEFEIVDALIKKGADINVVVESMTPLIKVIMMNDYGEANEITINLLIDAGASLEPVDQKSAFNMACYVYKNEAIKRMLPLGVDLQFKDQYGKNALEHLQFTRNEEALKFIETYLLEKSLQKELTNKNTENKKLKI